MLVSYCFLPYERLGVFILNWVIDKSWFPVHILLIFGGRLQHGHVTNYATDRMVQFEAGSVVSEYFMVLNVDEETARLSLVVKVESFLRSQLNYFFLVWNRKHWLSGIKKREDGVRGRA